MRKLAGALIMAMLGLALGWGMMVGQAEDKPAKTNRSEGQKGFEKRPPVEQGGLADVMRNPKAQEEMKRHREVMKGLFEQARELKKKIMEAVKTKIEELKDQRKAEQKDNSGSSEDTEEITPPDKPGKSSSKGSRREAFKEEMEKLVEPYRPQAEAIAGQMTSEIILHHQNLLNILNAEQANIKKKITEQILMPKRPGNPGWEKGQEEGKRDKPKKSECPNCPKNQESPK